MRACVRVEGGAYNRHVYTTGPGMLDTQTHLHSRARASYQTPSAEGEARPPPWGTPGRAALPRPTLVFGVLNENLPKTNHQRTSGTMGYYKKTNTGPCYCVRPHLCSIIYTMSYCVLESSIRGFTIILELNTTKCHEYRKTPWWFVSENRFGQAGRYLRVRVWVR